ncbi:putative cleavage and polyadenylation specificity factor subunit 4-like protein isoform X8 [Macaca fascicularis]|uniref:putative cleavage and polyadenylation specificity factor subunit 4-like protein isoform X8 n=1 Tax=Macaca fascicularis TaxID=9541 RepID=UPI003D155AF3
MQEVIAGLERFTFAFEEDVEMQKGTGLLPFPGMDKSASAVCNFFAKGLCEKGPLCKYRHVPRIMCLNYLVGFCPEGPKCRFSQISDVQVNTTYASAAALWINRDKCKDPRGHFQ